MGIINLPKVFVALPTTGVIFLCLILLTPVYSSYCKRGEYLDHELQQCLNCTICDNEKQQIVIRPCQVHRDTECGTLTKLWSVMYPGNKHRHRHQNHRNHTKKHDDQLATTTTKHDQRTTQEFDDLSDVIAVTSTEVPFSSVEALVWDWQAIALTFAVFSCILFFLVVTFYSFHQAKQWRRLKENFDADVEELSARLSLMAANCDEKGESLEPSFGPIHDGNYLNNRCVYLEQLLHVRKDNNGKMGGEKQKGNVYIEESNPNAGKT